MYLRRSRPPRLRRSADVRPFVFAAAALLLGAASAARADRLCRFQGRVVTDSHGEVDGFFNVDYTQLKQSDSCPVSLAVTFDKGTLQHDEDEKIVTAALSKDGNGGGDHRELAANLERVMSPNTCYSIGRSRRGSYTKVWSVECFVKTATTTGRITELDGQGEGDTVCHYQAQSLAIRGLPGRSSVAPQVRAKNREFVCAEKITVVFASGLIHENAAANVSFDLDRSESYQSARAFREVFGADPGPERQCIHHGKKLNHYTCWLEEAGSKDVTKFDVKTGF